ncbi:hypothetical protein [Staphylococcus epidermidis]|uniref:hypothetical protein n=1 Tax=Staphylococcus epidermidis TaxID=1282 RepID=UPI000B5A6833|nr:hypothetical protein [Staphylococcus epidermidis]ASJ95043.1 hypothetical protein CFE88_12440 [Staphylococcus epidermidis]
MRNRKLKMPKDLVEALDSLKVENEMSSRLKVLESMMELINNGYYDDVLQNNLDNYKRIDAPSELSKKTSNYIKAFEYTRLIDAIEDVLIEEINNDRDTDFKAVSELIGRQKKELERNEIDEESD